MGKRDKMKKDRSLTFHPAVHLLAAADRELVPIRALAFDKHGIDFADFSLAGETFVAGARFDTDLDSQSLELFAVLSDDPAPDVRFGLMLTYYIEGADDDACTLTFSRRLSEAGWSLEAIPNSDGSKDIRESLRRLGASIAKPKILKRSDAVLRRADRILKEYKRSI